MAASWQSQTSGLLLVHVHSSLVVRQYCKALHTGQAYATTYVLAFLLVGYMHAAEASVQHMLLTLHFHCRKKGKAAQQSVQVTTCNPFW